MLYQILIKEIHNKLNRHDNRDLDFIYKGEKINLNKSIHFYSIKEKDIIAIIQNDHKISSSNLFSLILNNNLGDSFNHSISQIANSLDSINNIILYPNSTPLLPLYNNIDFSQEDSIEEEFKEEESLEESKEELLESTDESNEELSIESNEESILPSQDNPLESTISLLSNRPNTSNNIDSINRLLNDINNLIETPSTIRPITTLLESNLTLLQNMGYTDPNLNRMALETNYNNISLAIDWMEGLR